MSKKRQLLIDTALDLFYHHGVKTIGINEIIKTSGVAKRTLYSHFASKEALIVAALTQRHQRFMAWLDSRLAETKSDHDVIEKLFTGLGGWFAGQEAELGNFRGCFFINTSAEFSDHDSDIAQYCAYHKDEVRKLIAAKLCGQKPYLLDAVCLMKEGAITTAYMTGQTTSITDNAIKILTRL
ncbi:TetR family transcriptional regulator [Vibrio sp. NH-UV-68]|uniref:TetR/AcrR family transcriptional regulator n=1 Tax=unclassified Vibrio TaxID=2614977 RepID=UPI0036F2BD37